MASGGMDSGELLGLEQGGCTAQDSFYLKRRPKSRVRKGVITYQETGKTQDITDNQANSISEC